MNSDALQDWLDRHHVDVVRTFATTLDGAAVGKYVHRTKFSKSLPEGHAIADMAAAMDLTGTPHLTFWHEDRLGGFGDFFLRPDLATLISDGTDTNLGHCICDFTGPSGEPFDLCSRTLLRKMTKELEQEGYTMKVAFELEFYLYSDSYDDLRRKRYSRPNLVSVSPHSNIYMLRNAYPATRYMNEVISRLEWKGIQWEGWNDEAGIGQFELNLVPTDPITAADTLMRTRQIMYEVARDLGMAVTFMSVPGEGMGSGTHIHQSLYDADDNPVFHDTSTPSKRSALMDQWIAGLIETLPAAVSILCPSINSYRRLRDFTAVPMAPLWGEENKSTAIRTLSKTPGATRVEHRVSAGDVNPYLAVATMIAGGLAGIRAGLELPAEFNKVAWGLPDHYPKLPTTISKAFDVLRQDTLLHEMLGASFVEYWAKTRHQEWLFFYTEGGDPESSKISQWEYDRYFEML